MAAGALGALVEVCAKYKLEGCSRFERDRARLESLPPQILLPYLRGLIESLEDEARAKGLREALEVLEEARRELEWMEREALD